jgi:hypothetical protein
MSFFGDLERFASDLYPYRWPIIIAAAVLLVMAVAFANRRGWHRALWRHKITTTLVVVPAVALAAAAGWYTLSPLWERFHLEEASPLEAVTVGVRPVEAEQAVIDSAEAAGGHSSPATPFESPFTARITHRGQFWGADDFHFGRGQAQLIETAPGRYTLRFDHFSVRNGPDLFVYLSPNEDGYADGAVNLGELKATDGAFNYDVPAGVDVSQFRSAIVWCKRFSVLFAVAPLEQVQ